MPLIRLDPEPSLSVYPLILVSIPWTLCLLEMGLSLSLSLSPASSDHRLPHVGERNQAGASAGPGGVDAGGGTGEGDRQIGQRGGD